MLFPPTWAITQAFAAPGVIYGQAVASMAVGAGAAWIGWRFVGELRPRGQPVPLETTPEHLHLS